MKKALRPLVIIFVIVNALAIVFRKKLEEKGLDADVVIVGNLVLFAATLISLFLYTRGAGSRRPGAVVGSVYSGFIIKFMMLIAAALIYFVAAKTINKPGIFVCMGLYLVYNFIGTSMVIKKTKAAADPES